MIKHENFVKLFSYNMLISEGLKEPDICKQCVKPITLTDIKVMSDGLHCKNCGGKFK